MKKERITISFNSKQVNQLRNESNQLGSSIASVVRLAIRDYFENKGIDNEVMQ